MTRAGRLIACIGVAATLLGAAAPVADAAPALGRWEATRADGRGLTFTVVRFAFGTAVRDVTAHCPDGFGGVLARTASWESRPGMRGDRTPILNPVDARGRVKAIKYGPAGVPGGKVAFRPLQGRLQRTRGVVRFRLLYPPSPPEPACDFSLPLEFGVRHVESVPIASGTWRAIGPPLLAPAIIGTPLPVHTEVTFRVGGGGAMIADTSGALWAQSIPGVGKRECSLGNESGLLTGRVQADGSFALVEHRVLPGPAVLRGRFTSATSVAGTFETPECGGTTPFSGGLVQADAGNTLGPGQIESIVDYVALGDSFSSGEGVDPYEPGTGARGGCHRSPRAYSQVLQTAGIALRRRSFACSGAVTGNVGRLGADGAVTGELQRPSEGTFQLDRLSEADWRNVGLVTLTIGGNDAEFSRTLTECALHACQVGDRARRILRRVELKTALLLGPTYAAITRRAPQATVVVLGYPRLFPGAGQAEPGCFKNPLPRGRQLFLNRVGNRLRDVLARGVRRAGFFYLDVMPTFAGHEPCGPADDWVHGLTRGLDRGVVSAKSYHPNAAGQEGYARALRRFLSCVIVSGAPLHADGLPANPGPDRAAPARCTPG